MITLHYCIVPLTIISKPEDGLTRLRQRTGITDLIFGTWNIQTMGINEWGDRARD